MNKDFTKNITVRYALALGIIALLSITAYFVLNRIVVCQKTSGAEINVSGSLRWLSQRAAAHSALLLNCADGDKREKRRRELLSTAGRMETIYHGLINGSQALNLPGNPSPQVLAICFDPPILLGRNILSYVTQINILARQPESKLTRNNPHYRYIVRVSTTKLLESLDTLVKQYENEYNERNARLQRVETGVLGFTLFVLLMEVLFVFKPMVRRINHATSKIIESESRIRSIVDSAWDGIITVNEQGIIESFNQAADAMFGYAVDELRGIRSIKSIMPHLYDRDFHTFTHACKDGVNRFGNIETLGQRKDDSTIQVEMSLSAARVGSQRLFIIIVRDITARKILEEQLRKLSCAVEQCPVTVIITDTRGNIEYVNPKFVQLTGYPREEALGKNPRILKSGMTSPEEYQQLWETITTGDEWRGEFYNKKKDGTFYWEFASISAIKNPQGEITHFVAVKEDITALRQTMDWLKESRERFRMLIESSRDGILAYNKEFCYTIWNRAMEQISGISRDAALGKNAFELFPFLDRVGEGDCFRHAVEGKAAARLAMPYNVPQTGKHGYFDSSHFPVFDASEKIVGGMAIIRNATTRVRTERRINAQHMVARVLSDAATLSDAFSGIVQVVCEALGWDCGGVWLANQGDEVLRCVEMWHVPLLEIAEFKTITMEIPFPPGVGLPGRVWSSARPEWIEDIANDTNFSRIHAAVKDGLNSAFAFPIVSGKEVLGVIEFLSHQTQAPDNDLLNMLGATGKQIGQFIKRKQAEERLQKLSHAVEQSSSSIVITDAEGIIEYVNPRFAQVTGYSIEEVRGMTPRILKSGEHDPGVYKSLWDDITSGKEWRGELCNKKKNGELYWEYASVAPVKDHDGKITHFVAVKEDITRRRQFESQLVFLANHDPLTNLINRRCFHEKLEDHLEYAKRYNKHGALLFLDLDNFKFINDTLGHSEGDKLLVKLSVFLQKRLRDTDLLGRLGGDEFAIYLPNVDVHQATSVAAQLLKQTQDEVIMVSELYKNVTLSIGVALFPDHGDAIAALLAAADLAMYQAKEKGKNCFCVYQEEHMTKIKNRLSWEERLRNALIRNSFVLYLQPIIDLRNNCVSGYEALLRMVDTDGKIIPPMDFLGVAERSVIIHDIDRWVVRHAIALITEQKAVFANKQLEINLSGRSFTDEGLLSFIKEELITSGIDPKQLVFEITETSVITNIREAQHFITTLESLGCHFALDDFGRGFSSFEYLKCLPVEYLKIDGGFISNLAQDVVDRQLVKAMVVMAHELGKKITAEFVSDEKTLQLLKEYGVDYAQGYHIGMPAEWCKIVQGISPCSEKS